MAKSTTSIPSTQIYGDGQNLMVFWSNANTEFAYTFESPQIYSVDIHHQQPREILPFGKEIANIINPMPYYEVDLKFKCIKFKAERAESGLLMPIDIFKNVSVSKLFRVINRKLKDREVNEYDKSLGQNE